MLSGLNHITIAVRDLELSFSFYTKTLGMKPHVKWATGAYLTCGDLWFCLSKDAAKPAEDYTHIAFNVAESQFSTVRQHLKESQVREWKTNSSEGDSVYLLDPDGHKLEVHSGDLTSRLDSLKNKPYKDLIWFQD